MLRATCIFTFNKFISSSSLLDSMSYTQHATSKAEDISQLLMMIILHQTNSVPITLYCYINNQIIAVSNNYMILAIISTVPQSGHSLLTQVRSMCSWTLPCVSSLVPSVLHRSQRFQCSPTLNRQPYEGRLPLTSWWRKSSNMTVGQSSLISLAHHCYDWNPGSRCR